MQKALNYDLRNETRALRNTGIYKDSLSLRIMNDSAKQWDATATRYLINSSWQRLIFSYIRSTFLTGAVQSPKSVMFNQHFVAREEKRKKKDVGWCLAKTNGSSLHPPLTSAKFGTWACYRVFVSAVKTQSIPKAFVRCHKVCDSLSDIAFRSGGVSLTVLAHDDSRTVRRSKPLSGSQSKVTLFIFLLSRRVGGGGEVVLSMLCAIEKLFYGVEALLLQKDVSSFKNTAEVRRNIVVSMNQLCHYRSIRSVHCSEINFNERNDKNSVGIMSLAVHVLCSIPIDGLRYISAVSLNKCATDLALWI